jgi:hypothetical protein
MAFVKILILFMNAPQMTLRKKRVNSVCHVLKYQIRSVDRIYKISHGQLKVSGPPD